MTEKKFCCFCGEPLKDGDVCYRCYENDRDYAYRRGYDEGYEKGLEEGKRQGRSELLAELENDIYIPSEVKARLRWRY